MDDLNLKKVFSILKEKKSLTITEIVNLSGLSRSLVRTILANLEGAKKVNIRKIGMAKIYSVRESK